MDNSQHFAEYKEKHNLTDKEITFYYLIWLSLGKNMSRLRQEYPTTPEEAFATSGNRHFDTEILETQSEIEGRKVGEFTYYKDYNPLHSYIIGSDVSHGVGLDHSTAVCIDLNENEVVAIYKNNRIEADVFAHELKNLGMAYGNCMISVESNDRGYTTLTELRKMYHNIYTEIKEDTFTKKETEKLGFHTTSASKPLILSRLKTAISENSIKINSKSLINELK